MNDTTLTQVIEGTAAPSQIAGEKSPRAAAAMPCEDKIRDFAYQKWQAAGRPEGDGMEFWLEAERELASQASQNDAERRPHRRVQVANPAPAKAKRK